MVKFARVMLMVLAALFLARGPVAYGAQPAPGHVHLSHAELAMHRGTPMDSPQAKTQCSKAGCALAACQVLSVTAAILPDSQIAAPVFLAPAYPHTDDAAFSPLRNGPPPPPPKSPIDHVQAA